MSVKFSVDDFEIGNFLRPYIIAEIGVNHEGSYEKALELIELAHKGGAHAAKFQTYKADKIASKHSPSYWDLNREPTTSQHALFKKYDAFGEKEYQGLAEYAQKIGIHFLSTPFDLDAVDMLDELMPAYKVASADITNIPLLRKIAGKGKPVIISTGASNYAEIFDAVSTVQNVKEVPIALLHCILNYPTSAADAQLSMLDNLKRAFPDVQIGYSDHVRPEVSGDMPALIFAALRGATVLEKHFTYDKNLPGNDHYHAMDMEDLSRFKSQMDMYRMLHGGDASGKDLSKEVAARLHARRSVYAAKNLQPGDVLSEENLIVKRPAHGISPTHWDDLIGKTVLKAIGEDTVVSWQDISEK